MLTVLLLTCLGRGEQDVTSCSTGYLSVITMIQILDSNSVILFVSVIMNKQLKKLIFVMILE